MKNGAALLRSVKTAQIRNSGFRLIYCLHKLMSALSNVFPWFGVRVVQIDHLALYIALVSQHPA